MKVVISSGHGLKVRGASGYLDEVDEARLVVEEVARALRKSGHSAITYHDDVSTSQSENLDRIVDYHNSQSRDVDISIHFNAYDGVAHGTEVLYVTQEELADRICDAICDAGGFTNRGPKLRSDLAFLNGTSKPSALVEVCFCDNKSDSSLYEDGFYKICAAIASGIVDEKITAPPPETEQPPPERPQLPGTRPELAKGDSGDDVIYLQKALGLNPADGDFGEITETQVQSFQAACGLSADGEVGQSTWDQVDALVRRVTTQTEGLPVSLEAEIKKIADASPLNSFYWPDRGETPPGYIAGMALAYAVALMWVKDPPNDVANDAIELMSKAAGDPDKDVLGWYKSEFRDDFGVDVTIPGIDTLRMLFVTLTGLGVRESSGEHTCGRDMTADNVEPETAEAGLFQTSWNIANGHAAIGPLLEYFWANPNGFWPVFSWKVEPDANDLASYGTGDGALYQFLARYSPLSAAMITACGARVLRQHWGPINRKEVTLHDDVDTLLLEVQELVMETATVPPDRPERPERPPPARPPESHPPPSLGEDKLVTVAITVPEGVRVEVLVNDGSTGGGGTKGKPKRK